MSTKRDYYEILGVSKSASADEMKSAYRKMAMKYHPDRNPGDKEAEGKFKELNEAYDVLRDEQKRAAYDRFGHQAFENGGMGGGDPFGGMGGFGGFGGMGGGGGFADIFDAMFGEYMNQGGGAGSGANRGNDLRFNLEISLEDAFKGKSTEIRVPSSVTCDSCHGSGAKAGTQPQTCGNCQGRGKVRMQQGFFTIERTCPVCSGAGRVIKDPCPTCSGTGSVRRERTLKVDIPAGVDDGTRIRLANEGEAGVRGGMPGDLYIFLSIKPHPLFHRDDANLRCRVPLPLVTAALGGQIEVPSIDGARLNISIPAGTQTGQQFRMRGKGMSILKSAQRGDLYIEVYVETPQNLSPKQQELLREFAEEGKRHSESADGGKGGDGGSSSGDKNSPESQNFLGRVKEFFEGFAA